MNHIQKITTILLYALFFALVGTLAFFIVYNAAFAIGDQHQFITTTAIGKFYSNLHVSQLNRFWPLGLLDMNLVLLFTPTPAAHFAINIPTFVVFALAVLALCYNSIPKDTQYNIWTQIAILCGAALIICRLYQLFLDLIYGEKILGMMLAVFLFCGIRFFQTNKWGYGIISLLAAVYATYCKEPIFGALLVFGVVLLLFGYKTLSKQQKIYTYLLIANCIVFISIYLLFIYSSAQASYSLPNTYGTKLALTMAMLRSQKMIAVAVLFAIWRVYKLIFKQEKEHLFFDAMLFAGVAYFCGMVLLNGYTNYFYMPAVVFVVPAILYFSFLYFKQWGALVIVGALSLFYVAKVPKMIKDNQAMRKSTPVFVQRIADYHQQGYNILWYKSDNPIEQWEDIVRDWQRTSHESYIGYTLKDGNFKFEETNTLVEYNDDKFVLLYSNKNAINNANELDSLVNTYSLETFQKNGHVDVFVYHP